MTFSTALFTPKRAPVPAPLPDTQPHKQFASVNGVAVESFRNPIVPGDHPDPAVLKDGADYYMTCSSGQCYPGAVIWHSRDLVNWVPCVAALNRPVGVVRAMDLVKHDGRYFLYIPVQQPGRTTVYVIHADDIRGPWSAPIDLCLDGCLGCGHAVGDDGVRHLFVNGDTRVRLTDDGLATVGARMAARVGDNPAVMPSAGSQVMRHGDFFYSVTATDGTDGSPGGHITVSRSRSLTGHWERCPFDPIGNAEGADGSGWTRGRAALVQAGRWGGSCCWNPSNGHGTAGSASVAATPPGCNASLAAAWPVMHARRSPMTSPATGSACSGASSTRLLMSSNAPATTAPACCCRERAGR
jgi:xylan 1,4-beta-xylosidase